jgi:3-dehydroquinate synthase
MTPSARISVDIAGAPYEVRIAPGLIDQLGVEVRPFLRKDKVAIVTDAHVAVHWRARVDAALGAAGITGVWLILPPGESTKSWVHLAQVVDFLIAQDIERRDRVIALGGGVIGDLTGFAASMVKRGCGFIQVPTTLLAQVDSSVGGKTAINTAAGKNLVGAFHQPALVLADPLTLDTLGRRETRAGYAEVVKYGLIDDADFFAWCETHGTRLIAGDAQARVTAIAHSVAAKARIVAADEKELTGVRALLNLGHTFGHALEAETGFSDRLLHGEGVAVFGPHGPDERAGCRQDRRALANGGPAGDARTLGPGLRRATVGRSHAARQENGRGHPALSAAARHRADVSGQGRRS